MKRFERQFVLVAAALAVLATENFLLAGQIDPRKATASEDGKTLWYDCKDIGVEGKGWSDTQSYYDRLPARAEAKAPQRVWRLSHYCAGLCVPFLTDATTLQVRWTLLFTEIEKPHMPATGVSGVDLYAKGKDGQWRFVANGRPSGMSNTASFKLPVRSPVLAVSAALQRNQVDRDRYSQRHDDFNMRRRIES